MAADVPELRLSDAERQDAMDALTEHVRTGRLDMAEFTDRSARVAAARLRSELIPVFADLPAPRPAVLDAVPPRGQAPTTPQRRIAASALPIAAVLAIALFFLIRNPVVFLLPAIVILLAGPFLGRR